MRTHLSSASVHLSLLVRARSGIVAVFLPPYHPGKRVGPDGAVSAPKGSLRSGSTFFAGLLQPFCLYQEVLGVVAANIKFLAFVSKIHYPEGSVSAFSDASIFRIILRFMAFGKVFQFLALCLGLSMAPQVFKQVMVLVRSFSIVLDSASALSARLAHSGVLPRVVFFL